MAVYQIGTLVPHYLYIRLIPAATSLTNKTIFFFDHLKYNERIGVISLLLSFSVPSLVCFLLASVGTIFLVVKLRQNAQIRKSMTGKHSGMIFTKEKILARSIIGICCIYIVFFSPNVVTYFVASILPSFHIRDPVYGNAAMLTLYLSYLLQSVSASVNLFVYMYMMTQYRNTFLKIFLPTRTAR